MTSSNRDNIGSQVRRLAHNAVALAFGGITAQFAFTLLEILIARQLGAEAYGTFVTAYAWTVLGAFLMEFGTPLYTIQQGSRDHSSLPQLLGSGLAVNLVMFSVLYLLLIFVTVFLLQNPVLSFMLFLLPYGLVLTLQNELASVYSSYQTMHISALFQGLAPVAILVVYFVLSRDGLALSDVGIAYVTGGGIVAAAWFLVTVRKVRPTTSLGHIATTLRSSYQYGLTGILGQIYFKADIVMLSAMAGLREAGIYAAAYKLADLVTKVAVLCSRVFAPALFKASHETGKSFDVFSSMMVRCLALVGLLAGVSSFLLAEDLILLLFGENYLSSVPILQIMGGVMAARCMMVALQLLLSSMELHFQRVSRLSVAVAVHIAANAVLIPLYGAPGAAIATLLSGAFLVLLYTVVASRKRSFLFARWLLVPSGMAALVAFGSHLLDVNAWAGAGISATVLLASLFATGFMRPDEVKFVYQSLITGRR